MKTDVGETTYRESICRELRESDDGRRANLVYTLTTRNTISGVYREIQVRKETWMDSIMVAETAMALGGQGTFADAVLGVYRCIGRGNTILDPVHLPDVVRDRWIGDTCGV